MYKIIDKSKIGNILTKLNNVVPYFSHMFINTRIVRVIGVSFAGSCLCHFLYAVVPNALFNFFKASSGERWVVGGKYPDGCGLIVLVAVLPIIYLEWYSLYQYPFKIIYGGRYPKKLQGRIALAWIIFIKIFTFILLLNVGIWASFVPMGRIACLLPRWLTSDDGNYPSIIYIFLFAWLSYMLVRYGDIED